MERWKSNQRVKSVLPTTPFTVHFQSETKQLFLTISRNEIEVVEKREHSDVILSGPDWEFSHVIDGQTMLSKSSFSYEGKYRQFLMVESFLWLTRVSD